MRQGLLWRAAALVGAVAAVATSVAAIEQRPLPVFTVVAADGAETPSPALVREGKWLLLYVTPSCRTCDGLLRDMARWDSAALPTATVLVVGSAQHADASSYVAATLPEALAPVAWFADARGEAREALRMQGAPVVIGMRDDRIQWAIAGVLNDPRTLESALRSWVELP